MFRVQLLLLVLCVIYVASADEKNTKDAGTVIGIDLGTTYSCVGIFQYGRVEILANDQGHRITPSYVAFTSEGERLIGDAAKNQLTSNPENTIFNVKRLIGRSWNEKTVQSDIELFPFAVVEKNNKPYIKVNTKTGEKTFAAEEISAMVLGRMKRIAESYLGTGVTHAVVTVPAYFNDAQRRATRDAGVIAGLNIVKILNEPTAAAIAYGLDKKEEKKNILVYDLGGGTFDVSILKIDNGVFTVVATNGDTHLGGEDFDQRVVDYFINMYKAKTGKDVTKDRRAVQKLRREVEKAKRILSSHLSTKVDIESFYEGKDFSFTLTRAKFEDLNMDLFQSTMEPVQRVLQDSGLEKSQIHEVVLVGGSTRILKIQHLVKKFFNGTEPSRGINPDEAVAYGAAVQAAIGWHSNYGDLVLIDICPLSLGVETEGEFMSKVIPRNTPVPVKISEIFTTGIDNQVVARFSVLEGERPLSKDNHHLGKFYLTGIRAAPKGEARFKVTFEIDANGILKVTAEEQDTLNKEQITIKNEDNRLSVEEIERMIKDVESYAAEEQKIKENVEAKSELEEYAYALKNLIDKKELVGTLSRGAKDTVKQAAEKTLKWIDEHQEAEKDEFNAQKKKLEEVVQPIISKLDQVFRDMDEL